MNFWQLFEDLIIAQWSVIVSKLNHNQRIYVNGKALSSLNTSCIKLDSQVKNDRVCLIKTHLNVSVEFLLFNWPRIRKKERFVMLCRNTLWWICRISKLLLGFDPVFWFSKNRLYWMCWWKCVFLWILWWAYVAFCC